MLQYSFNSSWQNLLEQKLCLDKQTHSVSVIMKNKMEAALLAVVTVDVKYTA